MYQININQWGLRELRKPVAKAEPLPGWPLNCGELRKPPRSCYSWKTRTRYDSGQFSFPVPATQEGFHHLPSGHFAYMQPICWSCFFVCKGIVIFFYYSCLFYYSCPKFSPFAFLCAAQSPLLQAIPTPLSMSMGHSYMFFDCSLPLLLNTPS